MPCDRNASCSQAPIYATIQLATIQMIMLDQPLPGIVQVHATSGNPRHALQHPHKPTSASRRQLRRGTSIATASTSHRHGSSGNESDICPPQSHTLRLRPSPCYLTSPTPNMPNAPLLSQATADRHPSQCPIDDTTNYSPPIRRRSNRTPNAAIQPAHHRH